MSPVKSLPSRIRLEWAAIALVWLLAVTACAPVTYNRYQPAQPTGRGKFKYMTSMESGRELAVASLGGMWDQMNDKIFDRRLTSKDVEEDVRDLDLDGIIDGIPYLSWGRGNGFPVPQSSFIFAYGVTNDIDLELSTTTSLYTRFGGKVRMLQFGRGTLSVSPAAGFLPINYDRTRHCGDAKVSDSYHGGVVTVESPFIVGWDFGFAAPYLALHLSAQHFELEFRRKIADVEPELEATIRPKYDLLAIGLALGAQFKFDAFLITPEIVGLYTTPGQSDWPDYFVSPGLALGVKW